MRLCSSCGVECDEVRPRWNYDAIMGLVSCGVGMASPCLFGTSRAALEGGRVGSIKDYWSRGAARKSEPGNWCCSMALHPLSSVTPRFAQRCSVLLLGEGQRLPSVEFASRKKLSRPPTLKVLVFVPLAAMGRIHLANLQSPPDLQTYASCGVSLPGGPP